MGESSVLTTDARVVAVATANSTSDITILLFILITVFGLIIRKDTLFFESTHKRSGAKSALGLLGGEGGPKIGIVVEGVEGGLKARVAIQGCRGVVGTTGLTLVAPKYPTVGIEGLIGGPLNCSI